MKEQLWEGPVHNAAIPTGAVSASFKPQDVNFHSCIFSCYDQSNLIVITIYGSVG